MSVTFVITVAQDNQKHKQVNVSHICNHCCTR